MIETIIGIILFIFIWKILLEPDYFSNLELPAPYYYDCRPASSSTATALNAFFSHPFHHVEIKKSQYESNCFMLRIVPQNYHFFVEHDRIIYHPVVNDGSDIDGVLRYYHCDEDFELAYQLPSNLESNNIANNPKVVCHRNLRYLKKYVYTNEIYYETFDTLQHPMSVLKRFFKQIKKIEGINKLIRNLKK